MQTGWPTTSSSPACYPLDGWLCWRLLAAECLAAAPDPAAASPPLRLHQLALVPLEAASAAAAAAAAAAVAGLKCYHDAHGLGRWGRRRRCCVCRGCSSWAAAGLAARQSRWPPTLLAGWLWVKLHQRKMHQVCERDIWQKPESHLHRQASARTGLQQVHCHQGTVVASMSPKHMRLRYSHGTRPQQQPYQKALQHQAEEHA